MRQGRCVGVRSIRLRCTVKLDPRPGRTMQRVKVSRALQKPKLLRAWSTSRDNTPRAGRPGIDGVTALQFATRLDANITTLAKSIRQGQHGPSPLKGVPIPKAYSTEKRLICIPTIRDRIVQRAV